MKHGKRELLGHGRIRIVVSGYAMQLRYKSTRKKKNRIYTRNAALCKIGRENESRGRGITTTGMTYAFLPFLFNVLVGVS